jgi:peptidoglycan/xylan/chitin deacetylase (PgdA/CDA1 family)
LFCKRSSKKLTVLAYHGIEDAAQFEKHMELLAKAMCPVSIQQLLEAITEGADLPDAAVLVTFDDGDVSILEKGAPILKKLRIPAVVYVVASVLDSTQPLWWNEVKDLARRGGSISWLHDGTPENIVRELKKVDDDRRLEAIEQLRTSTAVPTSPVRQLQKKELPLFEAAGIAVENHSLTHPIFPKCSAEKIELEISGAHQILCEALGHPPSTFAFPNGDSDHRANPILTNYKYKAAFLFDHKISNYPPENLYQISRVRVNSTTNMNRFRTIISGLHPALHHLIGRK